ncbi:MAG: right-handed parallel beta-helix repeat-containing protein [Sphaerochaeta sp.]|nr:right-handed parallel beta-helix repeat-containing protein [Sphaerochaeta sp.]
MVITANPPKFDKRQPSKGGYDAIVYIDGSQVIAEDSNGRKIASGVAGTDDTDCFDTAVAACPHNGKLYVGPGTFTLEANKLFYLNGGDEGSASNPFYYAIGILDGKNIDFCGSGVGSTILKMAANQHYEGHHAVMILNRTHWWWNDGATMFVVSDMTLDGNKAEQAEWYRDGSGLILTGSIARNFRFQRLWLKDSFGYGIYCGNNGSGPVTGLVINDVRITDCYKSGIMTDTASQVLINNCIISNSDSGLQILGNTDYQTRPRDNIVISDVICMQAGITLWCVNDVTMNGCYMDCTNAPMQPGLLIHSAIRVMVSASRFVNNTNQRYSTFIDANTYMPDGPTDVFFNNCYFEGSHAFRILGESVCTMHGGLIKGYRSCVYMVGEYEEPVDCKLSMHGVELLALQPVGEHEEPTLLLDIAEGGEVQLDNCKAPKAGYFQSSGQYYARDCSGAGLEGFNSRWRKEEGTFTATPASTSTITMTMDRRNEIPIGTPLRYSIGGTYYYGIVAGLTDTLMTVAGAPLTADIDALFLGNSEMVFQKDCLIPGVFDGSASSTLIQSKLKSYSFWRNRPAYLVQISHIAATADTGTAPNVTATISGGVVGTDNTNEGLPVGASLVSTGVGINSTNYRIESGNVIELKTTAGGTGDASDLTAFLTFVSES